MTPAYGEDILRALDPGRSDAARAAQGREETIWSTVGAAMVPRSRRRTWSLSALGASITAVVVALSASFSAPLSLAATTLNAAAAADSKAAAFSTLSAHQYYYQVSQVALRCSFAGTHLAQGQPLLTYVAHGTMRSWTRDDGSGRVVITPAALGRDGSHFATRTDARRWVAMGRPFIPCALSGAANHLGGNAANANTQSKYGGYAVTISGYQGFAQILASSPHTTLLRATSSINNLPSDASTIEAHLAEGQISPDGSLTPYPRTCPVTGYSPTVGCGAAQQLSVLEQLMSLPDASAKLGSVLYHVLAHVPGVHLLTANEVGNTGDSVVRVPQGPNQVFQVAFDPRTGHLLSCAQYVLSPGAATLVGSITYGPVLVVGAGSPSRG